MPDREPWDGGWGIGSDVIAAFTRKALDDAGITREQACSMTLRELGRVPGMDPSGVDRLWAHGIHSDEEGRRWPKPRPPLTDVERGVLEVLVAAGGSVGLWRACELLLPPKPSMLRRGGTRQWAARWAEMVRAWVALENAGLLAHVPDDGYLFEITDAGRAALASAAAQ